MLICIEMLYKYGTDIKDLYNVSIKSIDYVIIKELKYMYRKKDQRKERKCQIMY
ncbi:hypothetical protein HMPREF1011_02208 [Anaerostipes caccae]|nr:hypothetical protein HMPREF1011_02208 [Anaerostipes caccae]